MATDVIQQSREILGELGVNGLIVVGGDGSMTTALQLQQAGINCIGVPKTIDNDLEATAMTFGFDSAVAEVMDALDRLHTTATSHKRVMVLEVMGRHAGLDRTARRHRRRCSHHFDPGNPIRLRPDRGCRQKTRCSWQP